MKTRQSFPSAGCLGGWDMETVPHPSPHRRAMVRCCGWLLTRAARSGEPPAEIRRKTLFLPPAAVFGPFTTYFFFELVHGFAAGTISANTHLVVACTANFFIGVPFCAMVAYALRTRALPVPVCEAALLACTVGIILWAGLWNPQRRNSTDYQFGLKQFS
eukprot:gene10383-biopygen3799